MVSQGTEESLLLQVTFSPALLKIMDEIVVNSLDNHTRAAGVTSIEIDCREDGYISVMNDGKGIPIRKHRKEKLYIPEMVFGHLLTGSNFDDTKQRFTGGRMGYGAKLTNIFSSHFEIETCDGSKKYTQRWRDNMSVCEPPTIEPCDPGMQSHTRVIFKPDYPRFGYTDLNEHVLALFKRRAVDAAVWCGPKVTVKFNGERMDSTGLNEFVDLFGMSPLCLHEVTISMHGTHCYSLHVIRPNPALTAPYNNPHNDAHALEPVCWAKAHGVLACAPHSTILLCSPALSILCWHEMIQGSQGKDWRVAVTHSPKGASMQVYYSLLGLWRASRVEHRSVL